MKSLLISLAGLLAACSLPADEAPSDPPAYVDEAPLPEGWPQPGPYNEVAEKKYPAYRAAFTGGKGERGSFWTLFRHIKKNDIPMTAPVEMPMQERDGRLDEAGMGFLYQNPSVNPKEVDAGKVEIRDVPAARVLSYAWQGSDSKKNVAAARSALEAELEKRGIEDAEFRILGYNGPGTPRVKQTWELQALLD